MVRINAAMRTADGNEFLAGLDAIADEIYRNEHPDRPATADDITTTVAQRRHDALAEMSRRATTTADTKGTKRRRPTITVIATVHQLLTHLAQQRDRDRSDAPGDGPGLAETPDGQALTPAELRRLACDADILPLVMGADSAILDAGRASRTPTPAQWDALVARDLHCTHPGCDAPAHWCDAHHIIHWADGGPTNLANLTLLCRRHHILLHKGHITVHGRAPHLEWGKSTPPPTDTPAHTTRTPTNAPSPEPDHGPHSHDDTARGDPRDRGHHDTLFTT